MSTVTIVVDDQRMAQLRESALDLGVSVEGVVQKIVDSFLEHRKSVQHSFDHVLTKNEELYRRFAI